MNNVANITKHTIYRLKPKNNDSENEYAWQAARAPKNYIS